MTERCSLAAIVAYLMLSAPSPADALHADLDDLMTSRQVMIPLEVGWEDRPRTARTRAWWLCTAPSGTCAIQ